MSPLFSYDPIINGIKFHLGKLNSTIYDAPTTAGELEHTPNRVNFIIVDSAAMLPTAINELILRREQIDYIKSNDGKYSGSLVYKSTYSPGGLTGGNSQTEFEKEVPNSDNNYDVVKEVQSKDEEVSTSEKPSIKTNNHEFQEDNSDKQEPINEIQSTNEVNINQQYLDIQRVLTDLTMRIEKIGEGLNDSKSEASSTITKILEQINSLKNDMSKHLPTLPVQPKEDDSVSISKIHLWIAGAALIVGFLLGTLIF